MMMLDIDSKVFRGPQAAEEPINSVVYKEFGFDDDPVYLERVVDMLVEHFVRNYKGSYEVRQILNFFETSFSPKSSFSKQHKGVVYQFAQPSVSFKIPSFARKAVLHPSVISEIEKHNPGQLKSNDFLDLVKNSFTSLCIDGQKDQVVLPKLATSPAIVWYTHYFFEQILAGPDNNFSSYLDSVEHLITNFHFGQILNASVMGHVLGFFSDHPNSEWNCYAFRRLSKIVDLPPFVLEAIQKDHQPKNSPKLQSLKDFWHAHFIQHWVLSQRLNSTGAALSPLDLEVARRRTHPPNETFPTLPAASNHGVRVAARFDTYSPEQPVLEHLADERNLQLQFSKSQTNLVRSINALIKTYHPYLIELQLDPNKQPEHWIIFGQKANELLIAATRALATINSCPSEEVDQLLDTCIKNLIHIIHAPYQKKYILIEELYGDRFGRLSKIEQVTLIIFTCLVFPTTQSKVRHLAVSLFSNKLYSMLINHYDQEEPPEEHFTGASNVFSPKDFSIDILTMQRLGETHPQSPLVWTQAPAYRQMMQQRYQVLAPLSEMMENRFLKKHKSLVIRLLLLALGLYSLSQEGDLFFLKLLGVFLFTGSLTEILTRIFDSRLTNRLIETGQLNIHQDLTSLVKEYSDIKSNSRTLIIIMVLCFAIALNAFNFSAITVDFSHFQMVGESLSLPRLNHEFGIGNLLKIPEEVSPESLRNVPYSIRAEVFFPDGQEPHDGSSLGFLPDELSVSGHDQLDLEGAAFENAYEVDSLDTATPVRSGTIHVVPSIIHPLVMPFKDYEIIEVYQVGGGKPMVDSMGNLHYSKNNLPKELLLVQKPLESRIQGYDTIEEFSGRSLPQYNFWSDWNDTSANAYRINQQLGGDPELQSLHLGFIQEINQVVEHLEQEIFSDSQARDEATNIMIHYAELLIEYTRNERTYSLRFDKQNNEELGGHLIELSQNPDSGYYCSVAASLVTDFFESSGFFVLKSSGARAMYFDDYALTRLGHVINILWTPNGTPIYIDATPATPNPGEDLSMLENHIPSTQEIEAAKVRLQVEKLLVKIQDLVKFVVIVGAIGVGGTGLWKLNKKTKQWRKKREHQLTDRLTEALTQSFDISIPKADADIGAFQALETQPLMQLLTTVEHVLLYLIDESKNNTGENAGLSNEIWLSRLANDAFLMLKNTRETSSRLTHSRVRDVLNGVSLDSANSTEKRLSEQAIADLMFGFEKDDADRFQTLLKELLVKLKEKEKNLYEVNSDASMRQSLEGLISTLQVIYEELTPVQPLQTAVPDLQSPGTD